MSRRDEQNWFAFGFALLYILLFLVLPYYRISVLGIHISALGINGWNLMALNPVTCLPLVLGLLMAMGSLLFSARIGVVIAAVSVAANFLLMLTTGSVLTTAAVVQHNIAGIVAQTADLTQTGILQLTIGVGAVVSLLLAVVVLVLEILAMVPKRHSKPIDTGDFDF